MWGYFNNVIRLFGLDGRREFDDTHTVVGYVCFIFTNRNIPYASTPGYGSCVSEDTAARNVVQCWLFPSLVICAIH